MSVTMPPIRIGQGWDLHRLEPGRKLILGGICISEEVGCIAHSDGDVLVHALIDALLGALCLGDIGQWFPDSDPQYRGATSTELLSKVLNHESLSSWQIANIDSTIILQKPKLADHIDSISSSLAGILGISADQISIKAKTHEKIEALGRGEAIAAQVSLLLYKL